MSDEGGTTSLWERWRGDPRVRPGTGWYLVALMVFLGGVGGGTLWLTQGISTSSRGGLSFRAPPGLCTVDADDANRYQVWLDEEGVPGDLPPAGVRLPDDFLCRAILPATGEDLPVARSWGLRVDDGSTIRYPIAAFEMPAAGRVEVRITGSFAPRTFRVQRSRGERLLVSFLLGGLLSALAGFGGPILAFLVYVRRGICRREVYGPDF